MRPRDFFDLFEQWKHKEKRTDQRVALLCSQLSNAVCATGGLKAEFKLDDFMPGGGSARQMDGAELLLRARALFPANSD